MSVQFSIPATSFVLKALIEEQIKQAYGGLTAPKVSIAPPPRPPAPGAGGDQPEQASLILYMHHAGPNPAWRNLEVPYVETDGTQVTKTPLVLDLQYLVAALGSDLEREALLGIAMVAFHRNGIVKRAKVKAILDAVTVPGSPTKLMESLTTEPLDDPLQYPESIKIGQQPVDIDMSTKLWSALQSPIRPSAYYLVTTTVLDTGDAVVVGKPAGEVRIAARPVANPDADPSGDEVIVQVTPL